MGDPDREVVLTRERRLPPKALAQLVLETGADRLWWSLIQPALAAARLFASA